jgi:hypothetical protein
MQRNKLLLHCQVQLFGIPQRTQSTAMQTQPIQLYCGVDRQEKTLGIFIFILVGKPSK